MYGVLTIVSINNDIVDLSIDDPKRVTPSYQNWTSDNYLKKFMVSSINHWIHTTAIGTVDNDNNFVFQKTEAFKGMILPIEDKLFHPGLKEIIENEINELKGLIQLGQVYSEKTMELEKKKGNLLQHQNDLITIKSDEKKYQDHDKYFIAIKNIDSLILMAESNVQIAEDELVKYSTQVEQLMMKFNFVDKKTLVNDANKRLQLFISKAKIIM